MWLEDLTNFVRDARIEHVGQSVFMYTMPHDLQPALMLTSSYAGIPVDPELPGYYKGSIQLIARAKKSSLAEAASQAASDLLTMENVDIGDTHINYLRPRHLPVLYPRSAGDYYEAAVNLDICFLA